MLGPWRKHFCYAGNVHWVISGNTIITEGLVLGGNSFVLQEMSLELYRGMLLLRKAWSYNETLLFCRKCPLGYILEYCYYGRLVPRRKHFYYAGNVTWVISGNSLFAEGLVLG